jgi:hypothetical protein
MIRFIAALLLAGSFLGAGEYIYKFSNAGVPQTRTHSSTGVVEIYTNLIQYQPSTKELHKIHRDFYSSMSYDEFIKATEETHPRLYFQITGENYEWIEFSKFKKIQSLKNIDKFIKN